MIKRYLKSYFHLIILFLLNLICVSVIMANRIRINRLNSLVIQKNTVIDDLGRKVEEANMFLFSNITSFGVDYSNFNGLTLNGIKIDLQNYIENRGIILVQINLENQYEYADYFKYFKKYQESLLEKYNIIISFLSTKIDKAIHMVDTEKLHIPYFYVNILDLPSQSLAGSSIIFLGQDLKVKLLFSFTLSGFYRIDSFFSAVDRL